MPTVRTKNINHKQKVLGMMCLRAVYSRVCRGGFCMSVGDDKANWNTTII